MGWYCLDIIVYIYRYGLGGSSPELSNLLNDWKHGNYSSKPKNGESPLDVESRAVPALYDCLLRNTGKNILFVRTFYINGKY